jgi:hypothetical protein
MIKVSVFPKEIKKEVVEDVGHLTVKYVKSYKTFYRCVEVIDDDLFLLKYITNDGETLFKAIKASNMDDIKTQFDQLLNKLELTVSQKEWEYYQNLEFEDNYSVDIDY